jgi:hypothetical protein
MANKGESSSPLAKPISNIFGTVLLVAKPHQSVSYEILEVCIVLYKQHAH